MKRTALFLAFFALSILNVSETQPSQPDPRAIFTLDIPAIAEQLIREGEEGATATIQFYRDGRKRRRNLMEFRLTLRGDELAVDWRLVSEGNLLGLEELVDFAKAQDYRVTYDMSEVTYSVYAGVETPAFCVLLLAEIFEVPDDSELALFTGSVSGRVE